MPHQVLHDVSNRSTNTFDNPWSWLDDASMHGAAWAGRFVGAQEQVALVCAVRALWRAGTRTNPRVEGEGLRSLTEPLEVIQGIQAIIHRSPRMVHEGVLMAERINSMMMFFRAFADEVVPWDGGTPAREQKVRDQCMAWWAQFGGALYNRTVRMVPMEAVDSWPEVIRETVIALRQALTVPVHVMPNEDALPLSAPGAGASSGSSGGGGGGGPKGAGGYDAGTIQKMIDYAKANPKTTGAVLGGALTAVFSGGAAAPAGALAGAELGDLISNLAGTSTPAATPGQGATGQLPLGTGGVGAGHQ